MEVCAELRSLSKHVVAEEAEAAADGVVCVQSPVIHLQRNHLSQAPVRHRFNLAANGRTGSEAAYISVYAQPNFAFYGELHAALHLRLATHTVRPGAVEAAQTYCAAYLMLWASVGWKKLCVIRATRSKK